MSFDFGASSDQFRRVTVGMAMTDLEGKMISPSKHLLQTDTRRSVITDKIGSLATRIRELERLRAQVRKAQQLSARRSRPPAARSRRRSDRPAKAIS